MVRRTWPGSANSRSISILAGSETPRASPSHWAKPLPLPAPAADTTMSSGIRVRNPSAAKPSERCHRSSPLTGAHR